MADETIIFVHIPRTAGTTLHTILDRQYRREQIYSTNPTPDRPSASVDEFKRLSAAQIAQIRLLRGHLPFGLHEFIAGPSVYFTLLREPVERVISYYYYIRREPLHYLHDYTLMQGMTLKRCIESRVSLSTDNFQTRMLSGFWDQGAYGGCTHETLELAKENLRERFRVVGLTERFDETLLLLKKEFGWGNIFYVRQNVTHGRPEPSKLPPDALSTIRNDNQLDAELYQYAQTLFETQIQQQGASFSQELASFRQRNRLLQPLLRAYAEMRRYSVRASLRKLRTR